MSEQQLPPGVSPIPTEEFLLAIGELYLQVRMLQRMQMAQQQRAPTNGQVQAADALREQP